MQKVTHICGSCGYKWDGFAFIVDDKTLCTRCYNEKMDKQYEEQSYCRHGTYIGDPLGSDYLCVYCELGVD